MPRRLVACSTPTSVEIAFPLEHTTFHAILRGPTTYGDIEQTLVRVSKAQERWALIWGSGP